MMKNAEISAVGEVVALQTDIVWQDREANLGVVRAMLEEARPGRGALVVLPEMALSGFSMDPERSADDGSGVRALGELARRYGVTMVAGVARWREDGAANEAVVLGPDGREMGSYRKLHPFSPPGEGLVWRAGERIELFRWGGFTVAPFVCYDLRFPEIFRAAAAAGADCFVVVANWPSRRTHHWSLLLRARAVENQAVVIGVNRCGTDPAFVYEGASAVIDEQGVVLGEAGAGAGVVRAVVDHEAVAAWREAFPALRDRRDVAAIRVGNRME
jgi:predicted amidohydrolase